MNSWYRNFADIVFPAINEERLFVLYSDNKFSGSNTPVKFIVEVPMIKENSNLSDGDCLNPAV